MVNNQENCSVPQKDRCHRRLQGIYQDMVFLYGLGPRHGLVEVAVKSEIS